VSSSKLIGQARPNLHPVPARLVCYHRREPMTVSADELRTALEGLHARISALLVRL